MRSGVWRPDGYILGVFFYYSIFACLLLLERRYSLADSEYRRLGAVWFCRGCHVNSVKPEAWARHLCRHRQARGE